jgi:hypothetical protein
LHRIAINGKNQQRNSDFAENVLILSVRSPRTRCFATPASEAAQLDVPVWHFKYRDGAALRLS